MADRRTFLRAAAFGVVLLLLTGLVLLLFQEASALQMGFEEAPLEVSGPGVFLLDLRIEKGQRIPIQSILAVLEQSAPGQSGKLGAVVYAEAECRIAPVPGFACPRDAPFSQAAAAVAEIRFRDAHLGSPAGPELGYPDIFGRGDLAGTTTGYGYDPLYGHGSQTGGPTAFQGGEGYGYGFATAPLVIRYEIGVDACRADALRDGRYFLTVLARVGGAVVAEDLSSPFTPFEVRCGETPAPEGPRVRPTSPPPGAETAYRVEFPALGPADSTVAIPDDVVRALTLAATRPVSAFEAHVARWSALGSPPGTATAPGEPVFYGSLTTSDDSALSRAAIEIRLDAREVPDGDRLVALGHQAGAWQPLIALGLVARDDGTYAGTFHDACCGIRAAVFDLVPPTANLTGSPGPHRGTANFTTQATDDVGVAKATFYLDGAFLQVDARAPYELTLDTTLVENGEHVLRVVVSDYAQWTATSELTVFIEN